MLSNHLILCCSLLHLPSILPSMSVFSNEWAIHIAAAAKSLQTCPTLCNPIDGSPPGSPIPGILQARTLEWAAISFSNAWKWKVKVKSLSRVRPLATPWTAAYQAPPSMGFSRQEYWRGVPLVGRWPKYWSFSFSINPFNEYSELISSRIDWFDLLAVQGTLKSLFQHHNSKASILRHSAFFMVQLSHPYVTTGKTIALTRWTFAGNVMPLLFNTLPRFVIAFLSRSKQLLISWLQCFWDLSRKRKSVTASTFPPHICHKAMGLDVGS